MFKENLIMYMIKPFKILFENKCVKSYKNYISIQIELATLLCPKLKSQTIFSVHYADICLKYLFIRHIKPEFFTKM